MGFLHSFFATLPLPRAAGMTIMAAAALYVLFALGIRPTENSLIARFTPDR